MWPNPGPWSDRAKVGVKNGTQIPPWVFITMTSPQLYPRSPPHVDFSDPPTLPLIILPIFIYKKFKIKREARESKGTEFLGRIILGKRGVAETANGG